MQNEKATILINEIEIEEVGGWVVVHFLVWFNWLSLTSP
jgi:hypothetical protein